MTETEKRNDESDPFAGQQEVFDRLLARPDPLSLLFSEEDMQTVFTEWERYEREIRKEYQPDIFDVCLVTGRVVLSWCKDHHESARELRNKLLSVRDFLLELYQA